MGPHSLSSFVVGVGILELNSPLLLLLLFFFFFLFFFFVVFVFLGEIKNVGMLGEDLGIWRWFSWVIFFIGWELCLGFFGIVEFSGNVVVVVGEKGNEGHRGWLLAGCLTLGFDYTHYHSCQYYTIRDTYHIVHKKFRIVSTYRKCSWIVQYSVYIVWIV